MKGITKKQQEVLNIIQQAINRKGYPPSMREVTAKMNLTSAAGIHKHIKALVKKGFLAKEDYLSRSLRVIDKKATTSEFVELPLVGYVAAGLPIEAIEQQGETLTVPTSMLGSGRDHFMLRVRGDSMVEENIMDGDYVIIEKRNVARNGEVVVALIHGHEATLKRFFLENGTVRLEPANAAMQPIVVPGDACQVQGIVTGVWRRY